MSANESGRATNVVTHPWTLTDSQVPRVRSLGPNNDYVFIFLECLVMICVMHVLDVRD